jgi:hypothetical protein
MKVAKRNVKKHARKLKHATETEIDELHHSYQKLVGDMRNLDSPILIALSVVGIAGILIFDNAIFDFISLVVLIYPFYIFAQRDGHQEGYYEGYYDRMTKNAGHDEEKTQG